VWSGTAGGASGFLRPEPPPPVVIGGFGPKMAELGGRVGDGINLPGGAGLVRLVEIARRACERSGRDPQNFLVTTSGSARDVARLAEAGVQRVIVHVRPPYVDEVERVARSMG
jgi:alkanesulfonate monooxygenase SsuD/methylene tetrahydromethanopterin reductase-like flavin-dependent oxidoreductase (luciferase family)